METSPGQPMGPVRWREELYAPTRRGTNPLAQKPGGVDLPVEAVTPVAQPAPARAVRTTAVQIGLIGLGAVALIYFGRPVLLPVFLATMAGMALKPLVRGLACWHIPPAFGAALVLCFLVIATGVGFFQLGRPAIVWMNEAPEHLTELRHRMQALFPRVTRLAEAAAAVTDFGASEEEKRAAQKKTPMVEVKDHRGTSSILNWTGTLVVGIGETLVLIYLLLASGDLFLQKLVRVMPTWRDKKRVVEISHEIQQNISSYLLSVSLLNLALGLVASVGFYFMGVPNAPMWGMLVAVLNFVPYFGPVTGVALLAIVGLLSFDTLWQGLLPAGWFLLLHFLDSNLVAPILLGRRFTLNPVVIFVSLIFWTWLWGMPGALLSVPILVSIKVVCDRVPTLAFASELLSSTRAVPSFQPAAAT